MQASSGVVLAIKVIIVFLAVAAFAVLFGIAIAQVWSAQAGKPPQYSQSYLYVATGLAALIGGIFAAAFGLKTQDPKTPNMPAQQLNFRTLASVSGTAGVILGAVYLVVYLVVGIGALVTWVIHPNEISDLVKNLGTTFLGLALPIVAAYFQPAT